MLGHVEQEYCCTFSVPIQIEVGTADSIHFDSIFWGLDLMSIRLFRQGKSTRRRFVATVVAGRGLMVERCRCTSSIGNIGWFRAVNYLSTCVCDACNTPVLTADTRAFLAGALDTSCKAIAVLFETSITKERHVLVAGALPYFGQDLMRASCTCVSAARSIPLTGSSCKNNLLRFVLLVFYQRRQGGVLGFP